MWNAETLDYKTGKPIRGGLFCEAVFGPVQSWKCGCGALVGTRHAGKVCSSCGVAVELRGERRSRLGRIELARPLAHIWFVKATPNPIGLLLNMTPREVERVVYCAADVIFELDPKQREPGEDLSGLRVGMLVEHGLYRRSKAVRAGTGGWVLHTLLARLNRPVLVAMVNDLRGQSAETEGRAQKRIARRLRCALDFLHSGAVVGADGSPVPPVLPASMVLTTVPVLPPDLRPILPLETGRTGVADVTELYRRLILRSNRYQQLFDRGASWMILDNEARAMQEALDALFQNGRHGAALRTYYGGHTLRSLSGAISGKHGRFRQNLLGKRVDFSARSVIAVGPDLEPHQCGIPVPIATRLFEPFLLGELQRAGITDSRREQLRWIQGCSQLSWAGATRTRNDDLAAFWTEKSAQESWAIRDEPKWLVSQAMRSKAAERVLELLSRVMAGKVVLLNRAPTLHRLSVQAFEPVLVTGSALRLHPLWCSPFNADFDGDQMAVHLPLSDIAQSEARALMLSTRNVTVPADGSLSISPGKDMVFGLHYLTIELAGEHGSGMRFASFDDALQAWECGAVGLHAPVRVRPGPADMNLWLLDGKGRWLETTVGRVLLAQVVPKDLRFRPDIGMPLDKGSVKRLLRACFDEVGAEAGARVADELKRLGFRFATRATGSLSMSDLHVPMGKQGALDRAASALAEVDRDFERGLLTEEEASAQKLGIWEGATAQITALVRDSLKPGDTLAMLASSGAAKGEMNQIRQLVGMRGLMADPSGRVIEYPIRASFKEGLSPAEYFISTHGARKGMADMALRTAKVGYLTRRLINVGQDAVISVEDCGAETGVRLAVEELGRGGMVASLTGRYLAREITHPEAGVVASRNLLVDEAMAQSCLGSGIAEAWVRSPLTCRAGRGLCVLCYGTHLGTGEPARVGDAVGIVAAQSIGEPGTQLTMRTFHTGGVAGSDIVSALPRVIDLLECRTAGVTAVLAPISGCVESSKMERLRIAQAGHRVAVPEGQRLLVPVGARVLPGEIIAAIDGWRGESIARTVCTASPVEGRLDVRASGVRICPLFVEESIDIDLAGRRAIVHDGDEVIAGQPLTEGDVDIGQLAKTIGVPGAQWWTVRSIQHVYRDQGVSIHDKHVEVIARQMGRYAVMTAAGDTPFFDGDVVEIVQLERENAHVLAQGGSPGYGTRVLIGITRAVMHRPSFIAGAAFQRTTSVLGAAALRGAVDELRGPLENVIVGNRIPCGTGVRGSL